MTHSPTYAVLNPTVAQWTVEAAGRLLATYAILQGLNLLAIEEIRFTAPALIVANQLPGSPKSWGLLLLLSGLLALAGSLCRRPLLVRVGHFLCAVWSLFFAIALGLAALQQETASTTGPFVYAAEAVLFVLIGLSYRKSSEVCRNA